MNKIWYKGRYMTEREYDRIIREDFKAEKDSNPRESLEVVENWWED